MGRRSSCRSVFSRRRSKANLHPVRTSPLSNPKSVRGQRSSHDCGSMTYGIGLKSLEDGREGGLVSRRRWKTCRLAEDEGGPLVVFVPESVSTLDSSSRAVL